VYTNDTHKENIEITTKNKVGAGSKCRIFNLFSFGGDSPLI